MGGLLGFRMGTILANFHDFGFLLHVIEKLHMFARVLMACVPKCFTCKFDMPSGPMEDIFFCLTDGLTNHLCCAWWYHVCVLGNDALAFEHASVLSFMFSQHIDAMYVLSQSILFLCVRASCLSSVSIYLFFRHLINFQSCFGLVFSVIWFSVLCRIPSVVPLRHYLPLC